MSLVYTGRWDWEQYPPPYNFLFTGQAAPQPAPILPASIARGGMAGLGDCGCGCKGAGTCGGGDGHSHGMGLFDSWAPSDWGFAEWLSIAAGAYFLVSVVGDAFRVKRVASKLGGDLRRAHGASQYRRRESKAARLRKEAERLEDANSRWATAA